MVNILINRDLYINKSNEKIIIFSGFKNYILLDVIDNKKKLFVSLDKKIKLNFVI